ncbi:MAG: response regulator [Clostridia bacterium]|nr:response regulator [Clostridia bacterium]
MKVLLLDENREELSLFEKECASLPDFEVAAYLTDPLDALEYAKEYTIDLAVLDTSIPQIDCFTLAEKLRKTRPEMIVVFAAENAEHAVEAIRQKADWIVLKPCTEQDVSEAFTRVRYLRPRLSKRISAHMFGKFDLYVNGERVLFTTKKAKELAALCISQRGGTVSTYEIIEKLWVGSKIERASETSGYRKAIKSMLETFKAYNIDGIFERKYGSCRVVPDDIDCDYYRLLNYEVIAAREYPGQLMPEYAWAKDLKKRADEIAAMLK